MIIVLDEFVDKAIAMLLVDGNDMVQELASQGSKIAFDEWTLPWTVVSGADFLDTAHFQEGTDTVTVDPVVVTEQEPGLLIEGHGFFKLKDDPFHAMEACDVEVEYLTTGMIEDNKDIQYLERQRRHRTEIDSPRFMKMVPDEGQPGLR